MSCNCCLELINKKSRSEIKCTKCDYIVCQKCMIKYTLESVNPCHCMKCKFEWLDSFIQNNFSKKFYTKLYLNHRRNVLYEMDKVYIPNNMTEVTILKETKILNKKRIELSNQILCIKREREEIIDEITNNNRRIRNINNNQPENEIFIYNRKCSGNNGKCPGFLNNKTWECGICLSVTCNRCGEIKLEEDTNDENKHKCDKDNIKTMLLLNKDTKPCPSCGNLIYKISGCNHMMCTSCKMGYDWDTGKTVVRNNTNPHYYEWLRQRNLNGEIPREPSDLPEATSEIIDFNCDRLIDSTFFISRLKKEVLTIVNSEYNVEMIYNYLIDLHQCVSHIQDIDIPNYENIQNNPSEQNKNLRLLYLTGDIMEHTYKKKLYLAYNKRKLLNEIFDIKNTFYIICKDILNKLYTTNIHNDITIITPLLKEILSIISFINKEFSICKNNTNNDYYSFSTNRDLYGHYYVYGLYQRGTHKNLRNYNGQQYIVRDIVHNMTLTDFLISTPINPPSP
jgi:hypothetical protein